MSTRIRGYTERDYEQCEELVNHAWGFDKIYKPEKFSALAKKIYTKGSAIESNYRAVAENDGKVVGFIFGLNEFQQKPILNIAVRLEILWGVLNVRSEYKPDKTTLLKAMAEHERNRAVFVGRKRSELVLFVIAQSYQRKGIGRQLWSGFLENCRSTGVQKIIVETNTHGASAFYEKLGFIHLADFHSPLHAFATPEGQACLYMYNL